MGKKAVIATITISVIVTLFAGMQAVEVANANPLMNPTPPQNIIWVYLTTINGNSSQSVTILMPNLSYWYVSGDFVASLGDSSFKLSYGPSYWLDQPFGLGANQGFPVYFEHHNETEQGQGNITLEITVANVQSYSLVVEYAPNNPNPIPQPTISILSPLNDSFFNVSIEGANYRLVYETNSSLSWVGYSIDSASNVTVTGNNTFVHDFGPSGYHLLTVYANDTSNNWAIPQTVTYLVNYHVEETPSVTPSPTPSPTIPEFPSFLLVSLLMIAVMAGVISYRIKMKKAKRSKFSKGLNLQRLCGAKYECYRHV